MIFGYLCALWILTYSVKAVMAGLSHQQTLIYGGPVAALEQRRQMASRTFGLDNGIPSQDTFGRVFSPLSPSAFQKRFSAWVGSVQDVYEGEEIVAIDGKSLRRSLESKRGQGPLHVTVQTPPSFRPGCRHPVP